MVFTREQQEKFAPSLSTSDYLVVSTREIMFSEDQMRLRLGLEIVTVLNIVGMINRMFDKVGGSGNLDPSILTEVLDSLMRDHDNTLEEDQLIEYFTFQKNLGKHYNELERFADFNNCLLPYELDLVLLGIPIEEYWYVKEHEEKEIESIHSEYGFIRSDLVWREGSVSTHIKEAKKLLKKFKEAIAEV